MWMPPIGPRRLRRFTYDKLGRAGMFMDLSSHTEVKRRERRGPCRGHCRNAPAGRFPFPFARQTP
jgi:hypothetical protein